MISLKQILNEIIAIYGYWIEQNGKIHNIKETDHAPYAIKNFRHTLKIHFTDEELDIEENMYRKINNYLILQGFIRIGAEATKTDEIWAETKIHPPLASLQSFKDILYEKNIKKIYIEIISSINQFVTKDYLQFNSIEEFEDYFNLS